EISQFRGARLQAISHFEGLHPRRYLRVSERREFHFIQFSQGIERSALRFLVESFWIRKIKNRVAGGAERRAAINRRHECAAPMAGASAGAVCRTQYNVTGQVLGFASKTVERPRSKARAAKQLRAGVHQDLRRRMIYRVSLHRSDEAKIVRNFASARKQFGKF